MPGAPQPRGAGRWQQERGNRGWRGGRFGDDEHDGVALLLGRAGHAGGQGQFPPAWEQRGAGKQDPLAAAVGLGPAKLGIAVANHQLRARLGAAGQHGVAVRTHADDVERWHRRRRGGGNDRWCRRLDGGWLHGKRSTLGFHHVGHRHTPSEAERHKRRATQQDGSQGKALKEHDGL